MSRKNNQHEGVDLREYFEMMIAAAKESSEKALIIARDELARRLDTLNGEAGRLSKMQETYYPRQVAEPAIEQIQKDVNDLQLTRALLDGKANQNSFYVTLFFSVVGLLVGFCGLATALISLVLRILGL